MPPLNHDCRRVGPHHRHQCIVWRSSSSRPSMHSLAFVIGEGRHRELMLHMSFSNDRCSRYFLEPSWDDCCLVIQQMFDVPFELWAAHTYIHTDIHIHWWHHLPYVDPRISSSSSRRNSRSGRPIIAWWAYLPNHEGAGSLLLYIYLHEQASSLCCFHGLRAWRGHQAMEGKMLLHPSLYAR